MKEVTKWDNKPRWMWCWDYNEHDKRKEYVEYIYTKDEMREYETEFPVITNMTIYKHCEEIEEMRVEL